MKILYGIQTTGNGHISRSMEIIKFLKIYGHDIEIILSGPDSSAMNTILLLQNSKYYNGLTFSYSKGKIKLARTIFGIKPYVLYRDISSYNGKKFDVVISDFEPISSQVARRNKIPSIGIGHQYAFLHNVPMVKGKFVAKYILRNFAPVDYPVGIHWHHYYQPIIPPVVPVWLREKPSIKNKILVYLPFEDQNEIKTLLTQIKKYHFYIYGECLDLCNTENITFSVIL